MIDLEIVGKLKLKVDLKNPENFEQKGPEMRHPESKYKTLIRFFNDKNFDHKQDIVLDIENYYAIVSVDRRTQYDQETNRFIVVGLKENGKSNNKLVKLNFVEDECNSEDVLY